MRKLRLGVLPIKRSYLSLDVAAAEKERVFEAIRTMKQDAVTLIDIEDICNRGIAYRPEDIKPVVEKFKQEKVDAVFLLHCDFGEEQIAVKILREFRLPVLLWGPRDQYPSRPGMFGRDTQCGIFADAKVLSRNHITFSYIYNVDTDTEEFRKGYVNFLRTATIVRDLKDLRIAQIGQRPTQFMSVIASEAALVEKFGIEVVPVSPYSIIRDTLKLADSHDPAVESEVQKLKDKMDCQAMTTEQLQRIAALKVTVLATLEKNDCRAGAIECWTLFPDAIGVPPCMIISELADMGLPLACECDLNGALTSVIAQAAALNEQAIFFADLTIRHPENDNAELLWHCGPFPYSLKKEECQARMVDAYATWELKEGDITILRCDEIEGSYYLTAAEGKAVEGPETTGSYVWFETGDWKKMEETFVYGPYIHHVAGVYGKYITAIQEAARYLPVKWDPPGGYPESL
ncbi:L-fucose/L-arabinose isomerase family protein [Novisyntrophococcus fermenticellae]|uniref:L-fucose/L-arabinose isomerase family protein n=1 Tax=Novisyntrophococcus fermenticellae TaxID=2068655 RepID=UPI001E295297|nr:fucose isomerase [Novisyntrophococcus fermenticellae]